MHGMGYGRRKGALLFYFILLIHTLVYHVSKTEAYFSLSLSVLGSDRSNLVLWRSEKDTEPAMNGQSFDRIVRVLGNQGTNSRCGLACQLASMGVGTNVDELLNNAPASYRSPPFQILPVRTGTGAGTSTGRNPGTGRNTGTGGGGRRGRGRGRGNRGRGKRRVKRATPLLRTYFARCTRNDNFSNRNQKVEIRVYGN